MREVKVWTAAEQWLVGGDHSVNTGKEISRTEEEPPSQAGTLRREEHRSHNLNVSSRRDDAGVERRSPRRAHWLAIRHESFRKPRSANRAEKMVSFSSRRRTFNIQCVPM
jgi:hypothetical protein